MNEVGLPARRRWRWLIGALVVSLALNAFLVGIWATDWFDGGRGSHAINIELRWLQGKLPEDAMTRVSAAVELVRPAAVAHLDKLKQLRAELGALAAAATPDRAAIDAKLMEIRGEISQMLSEVQRATIDSLLTLPTETRARLAEGDTPSAK